MSQRSRIARTTTVLAAFALAAGMTPRADAEQHGASAGGSRSGSVSSSRGSSGGGGGRSTSSGSRGSSSGRSYSGHSVTSSGPRSSGGREYRGTIARDSGSYGRRGGGHGGYYGGGSRHGGSYWRGGWYGGHYYPRWYSNWYWGFTPYWASYGWLWGWPWYYDPFWSDWRYVQIYGDGGPYYGDAYAWRSDRGAWSGRFGRVKTDVEPDEAEVLLNGKYIGTADDFDGYPDFLYLAPGSYKLEFRLNGYQPYTTDVNVERGALVRISDHLTKAKGRSLEFLPESKGMPSGRFFDANGNPVSPDMRRGRERPRAIEDEEGPIGIDDRRDRGRGDVEEDRAPESRHDWDRNRDGEKVEPAPQRESPQKIAPAKARLRWKVTPDDAAVWVDDQYVGTAEELSSRDRGTTMAAGHHTVTVVRPGYRSRTVDVDAKAGESVDVVVELEK